jgi:hypothetical protein
MMEATADDKKYAYNTDSFRDVVIRDGIHEMFEDSPISSRCSIGDICKYAPGELNKIGKEGKTSWDSFSYALLMGHNVWQHIRAVQDSNRLYDEGQVPGMLVDETFTRVMFRDVVDKVFAPKDFTKSMDVINHYSKFWDSIKGGSRGTTGKKIVNSKSQFNVLFD